MNIHRNRLVVLTTEHCVPRLLSYISPRPLCVRLSLYLSISQSLSISLSLSLSLLSLTHSLSLSFYLFLSLTQSIFSPVSPVSALFLTSLSLSPLASHSPPCLILFLPDSPPVSLLYFSLSFWSPLAASLSNFECDCLSNSLYILNLYLWLS